ncbi:molybdopterin molybdotransferase [Candidatus Hakubella thermalkaliphila]|uniref:Molybdopterin molybdenumtransferase n=1 Tax=Candidatus Hakubella thermalkaliphila TaxID=2754717 RepID=A0A6V8NTG7_9ACTN|nr:gephyrin-like molybdotransferase Glp [Candidatus Hakubella thermalkaliphila]GFP21766.1 molybdopterin molybdotransferase [Candidatus Hakubella thermalkaliphila]
MLSPERALQIVLDQAYLLEPVELRLLDSRGMTLAEEIVSDMDIPPFDNSAMDGFAIRSPDTLGASLHNPVRLKVLEEDLPAGHTTQKSLMPGYAFQIMTGAPIPAGADAVIPVEDVEMRNEEIWISRPYKTHTNIRDRGEEVRAGEVVLTQGKTIYPADIGLLASLGRSKVAVIRKAKVAVIATGDELIDIEENLQPGLIRDSNSYSLTAQIAEAGAIPQRVGIVADQRELVRQALERSLMECDIVLTSGGVSVGKYDLVKEVVEELGAELKFWKVSQKPGKPLAFWTYGQKLVFGLPGNPVAVMFCFERYVRPLILKMMGRGEIFRPTVKAALAHDLKIKTERTQFMRVMVGRKGEVLWASSTGAQGSGILRSMSLANGIATIPPQKEIWKQGELVEVMLIREIEERPERLPPA